MPARRFPPRGTAELTPNCFIVRDANGQALSYICYESEPGRRSAKVLTETVWQAVPQEHQRGCFALEEERGGSWKGSGVPAGH